MKTMTVTVCPVCEAQRNYFGGMEEGKCNFCNTDLHNEEIKLPKVDSPTRLAAEKYLEDRRNSMGNAQGINC